MAKFLLLAAFLFVDFMNGKHHFQSNKVMKFKLQYVIIIVSYLVDWTLSHNIRMRKLSSFYITLFIWWMMIHNINLWTIHECTRTKMIVLICIRNLCVRKKQTILFPGSLLILGWLNTHNEIEYDFMSQFILLFGFSCCIFAKKKWWYEYCWVSKPVRYDHFYCHTLINDFHVCLFILFIYLCFVCVRVFVRACMFSPSQSQNKFSL